MTYYSWVRFCDMVAIYLGERGLTPTECRKVMNWFSKDLADYHKAGFETKDVAIELYDSWIKT